MKPKNLVLKAVKKISASIFGWLIFLGGLGLGIFALTTLVSAIESGKIELIFEQMIFPIAIIAVFAIAVSTVLSIARPKQPLLVNIQKISREARVWFSILAIVLPLNVGLLQLKKSDLVRQIVAKVIKLIVEIVELAIWAIVAFTCMSIVLVPLLLILSYRAKVIERKDWSPARRVRVDRIEEIRRSRLERDLFVPNGLTDPVEATESYNRWNDDDYQNYSAVDPEGIGDLNCEYNARSLYLRCAVHPNVDTCDGCRDYRQLDPCDPHSTSWR